MELLKELEQLRDEYSGDPERPKQWTVESTLADPNIDREQPSFPHVDNAAVLRRLQDMCSNRPLDLDQFSQAIVREIRHATGGANFPLSVPSVAADLRKIGYGKLESTLTGDQIGDVHAYLEDKLVVAAHNPAYAEGPAQTREQLQGHPAHAYRYADVIHTPHLLELALDPTILGIVGDYLGCLPLITEMNLLWTNPSGKPECGQSFHRDQNDFRWVTMFVYLTDVDADSGPHCFVRGTHRHDSFVELLKEKLVDPVNCEVAEAVGINLSDLPKSAYTIDYHRLNPFYIVAFGDRRDFITGPAGTIVLEDTRGLHYGVPPRTRSRLAFWAVYGTYENVCFNASSMTKVPLDSVRDRVADDRLTRYVSQLVVDRS